MQHTFKVILTDPRTDAQPWMAGDLEFGLRSTYTYASRDGVTFEVTEEED